MYSERRCCTALLTCTKTGIPVQRGLNKRGTGFTPTFKISKSRWKCPPKLSHLRIRTKIRHPRILDLHKTFTSYTHLIPFNRKIFDSLVFNNFWSVITLFTAVSEFVTGNFFSFLHGKVKRVTTLSF